MDDAGAVGEGELDHVATVVDGLRLVRPLVVAVAAVFAVGVVGGTVPFVLVMAFAVAAGIGRFAALLGGHGFGGR